MEIEHGVKVEYGGDSEAGMSSGFRSIDDVPAYTGDEIERELGRARKEEIEQVFRHQGGDDAAEPEFTAGLS